MNCKWHRMLRKTSPFISIGYLALHQDELAFEWHIEMPMLSSGIDFYFFSVLPSLFTQMLFAWLLTDFTVSWGSGFADRSRLSPFPEPSQEPWGWCKAKPRLVGFDSCRNLAKSKDFYCFLISRECEVVKLFPEIWEAESAVNSFNTARSLHFSQGFTIRTMLPLRMLWGGTCTGHFEALIQNTLA